MAFGFGVRLSMQSLGLRAIIELILMVPRDRMSRAKMLVLCDREGMPQGLAEALQYKGLTAMERNASVCRVTLLVMVVLWVSGGCCQSSGVRCPGPTEAVGVGASSPASIAGRLPAGSPEDQESRVSHEAIQWVYAQPVSSLPRTLISLLTRRRLGQVGAATPAPRIASPAISMTVR